MPQSLDLRKFALTYTCPESVDTVVYTFLHTLAAENSSPSATPAPDTTDTVKEFTQPTE